MWTRLSRWLRTTADRLDPPRDTTMRDARAYGLLFSETQEVPRVLERDKKHRANIVVTIDRTVVPFLHGGNAKELYQAFSTTWSIMQQSGWPRMDEHDAISVGLRLWAGAICGAKLVAYQTRSGVNGRRQRERGSWALLPLVRQDKIFAAGVGCALALKRARGQQVTLDGVHPDVRRILEGR